jgi:signal transduction histidine kinase
LLLVAANVPSPGGLGGPPGGARGESADRLDRFMARQPAYRVILAIPANDLASAWGELAPGLATAALIAILASAAVAWWLARSITRPLGRITTAAQAIARGQLRQRIPEGGSDEVAQLARAFNRMSEEVARSHRALKEFLANASHELRTPLTSIQGFSQALLDGTLAGPDGGMEASRIINEEAERMRKLVEDLLYLSRVEAAEVPASRDLVDVGVLLREGVRRLQLAGDQRRLEVVLDAGELPYVAGDADQLDHLFGNLLDNAAKYTPPGGRIEVRAQVAGDRLTVTVHNTGSYIPPEDLPHVFERFYRVDKSRAREIEGSGLGLAIAKEVAERHGGTIGVASDRERGTTFTVLLPVAADPGPAQAQGEGAEAQSGGPQGRAPRLRHLVGGRGLAFRAGRAGYVAPGSTSSRPMTQ